MSSYRAKTPSSESLSGSLSELKARALQLREAAKKLEHAIRFRRFVKFITCDRKTALDNPVHGYRTSNEGPIYFYCEHIEGGEFTSQELKQLYEYPECCYHNGVECDHDDKQCDHEHHEEYGTNYTFEIDQDSVDEEKDCGLIPPRFWLLTPSAVSYKDNSNIFDSADTRYTETIFDISVVASKLEAYDAGPSERKLIQKFWSSGMTTDLCLKDFHVLPNKEWFDYRSGEPSGESKKRKREKPESPVASPVASPKSKRARPEVITDLNPQPNYNQAGYSAESPSNCIGGGQYYDF